MAAECSLSGSKKSSGSPQRFVIAVHDRGVEAAAHGGRAGDRIGPGRLATLISTCTTASAPSQVVGMPGKGKWRPFDPSSWGDNTPACSIRAMVLIPTSLAGFSPECFPERVGARSEGFVNDGHVELKVDHAPKFLNSQDILIKLLLLYILHLEEA